MTSEKQKKLSKQQKKFCEFKAQGYSNEESAVRAGYSKTTAKTKSHLWIDKSQIKAEIERLKEKFDQIAADKFGVTTESIIRDILEIKDRCMQKVPVMVRKGKDWEQKTDENGEGVWDFDSQAALKACDMLAKHKGLYEKDNEQRAPKLPDIHIGKV